MRRASTLLLPLWLLCCLPLTACVIIDPRPVPMPPEPVQLKPMETRSHAVEITIDQQAVTVDLEAVFFNPNGMQLEGTYFFPLPSEVAVSGFSLWMDGKEQKGELLDAAKARQVYEEIVRRRKDPGLLEYIGTQMIKVRVFPVPANGEAKIRLVYRHLIAKDAGLFSFRYPLASAMPEGRRPIGRISLKVALAAAAPLKNLYSPSHAVDRIQKDDLHATVGFEGKEIRPERDFQLFWSESGETVGADVLTCDSPGEAGYFMLLLSPQVDAPAEVAPKDVVFVLDKSGSMQENGKIGQAKNALRYCLRKLDPRDRFSVIAFSTAAAPFRGELLPATKENVDAAVAFVDAIEAAGGTAIDEALGLGLGMLAAGDRLPMLLFLTDGQPTVGETVPEAILKNAAARNAAKARLFVFGVGPDVNTLLLDRLAGDGRGARDYVAPQEDIEVKVSSLYAKIASPALSDVTVVFEGAKTEEVYPRVVPDLFQGAQAVLLGRFEGKGEGRVRVRGRVAGQEKEFSTRVAWGERRSAEFLPALWAVRKVGYLLDQIRLHGENRELVDEVTRLAKRHGIATPYTSFLVAEDEIPVAGDPPVQRPLAGARRLFLEAKEQAAAPFARDAIGAGAQAASRATDRYKAEGPAAPAPTLEFAGEAEGFDGAVRNRLEALGHKGGVASGVRRIDEKTFVLKDGVWTDGAIDPERKEEGVEVEFASEAYFSLLRERPRLAKYFALGDNVAVLWDGILFRVKRP